LTANGPLRHGDFDACSLDLFAFNFEFGAVHLRDFPSCFMQLRQLANVALAAIAAEKSATDCNRLRHCNKKGTENRGGATAVS
jgi:hypothetical protein